MNEMSDTAKILNNATENSFIIMDEIGRGTSPSEGLAIAYATSKFLIQNLKCRTLFATHYSELSKFLLKNLDNKIQFLCTSASLSPENNIILIPKLSPGVSSNSFAIPVAKIAGLPSKVIEDAALFFNAHQNVN
jgi:DNA mismatch repair protein MutS